MDSKTRKFPKTLQAVKAEEGDKWKIADALVDEVETDEVADAPLRGEMQAAAEWLAVQGFPEYSTNRLGKMWKTATEFSLSRRRKQISFEAHLEAVEEKTLEGAIKEHGSKVSKRQVIAYRKALLAARKAAAERRKAKAERARRDAEEAKQRAEEEQTEEANEAAETAEVEAQKAEGEAAPRGTSGIPDPGQAAVERQDALFKARGLMSEAKKAANEFTEIVQKHDLAGAGEEEDLADRIDVPAETNEVVAAWLKARDDLMAFEQKDEVKV